MTRDDAILAINAGYSIRHEIFRPGFCIYIHNGKTHNSDGTRLGRNGNPLLMNRKNIRFDDGWSVVYYKSYWCSCIHGYITKPFPFKFNYYKTKR